MSITTIAWKTELAGIPGDVTTVTLQDPTNEFGVIRKDTNEVVVPAGTPLIRISEGEYEYSFVDPGTDLEYQYYIRTEYNNIIFYYERDQSTASEPLSNNVYATSECLYRQFGQENILTWTKFSDSEDDEEIIPRIAAAITYANGFVNDALRGGPYILPFTHPIPIVISNIACIIAGIHLYEARGIEDYDGVGNRLSALNRQAQLQLTAIKSGRLQLAPLVGEFRMAVIEDEE